MSPRLRNYSVLFVVVLMSITGIGLGDEQREMEVLRSQIVAYFTQGAPRHSTVMRYVKTLQSDGTWFDIDYANQQRGGWLVYQHMSRILDMSCAYRCAEHSAEGSPEVRNAVVRALEHWLKEDYRNANWWYGRIGIPRLAAPILILMEDDLPSELRSQTINQILTRSRMGMTGQNEVWVAGIAFMKGILSDDVALMQKARDSILSQLRVTTREGIQADMSFHQHGPQQQWGNYGSSFGSDMLKWSTVFQNTRFAADSEQHALLVRYLTEGAPWIVWRGFMDVSGCGRQVFPGAQASKGGSILRQLQRLMQLDATQQETVNLILTSQSAGQPNRLLGHRHYWRSDISVHRRPDWYASVKMSSMRVIGAETCNRENLMGLHLGDGATFVLCTGREYEDLFPLWDWRRLPGTTCRQDDRSLVPSSRRCRGGSDFVGGVTNGRLGAAVLEYCRDGLRANKSWFFLDDQLVCLGNGITCDDATEVATSIEQARLDGPIIVSEASQIREVAPCSVTMTGVDWIHHAGVGYRPLQPVDIQMEAGDKVGDWRRVNDQVRGERFARGSVFSLWISHGASPQRADYAYSIFPASTVESMQQQSTQTNIRVLQNSESVQAVSVDGGKMVLATFHAPVQLALDGGDYILPDIPCVLFLDQTPVPARLYVADPTHKAEAAAVRISFATERDIYVALPTDDEAGSTVAVAFQTAE
jgi:chondroitin AC lyase